MIVYDAESCCVLFETRPRQFYGSIQVICEVRVLKNLFYLNLHYAWEVLPYQTNPSPFLFIAYTNTSVQCFSSAWPRPDTGPWYQLYRAARGSSGICQFSFLCNFHE